MEDEEKREAWQRNISFTAFQIIELVFCFFFYLYFTFGFNTKFSEYSELYVFILHGFTIAICYLILNIYIRFYCKPRHTMRPLEVVISLWLWMIFLLLAVGIMRQIPRSIWTEHMNKVKYSSIIHSAKVLIVFSIVMSKIFLLDGFLRLDVLIIRLKKPTHIESLTDSDFGLPSDHGPVQVLEPLKVNFFWNRWKSLFRRKQMSPQESPIARHPLSAVERSSLIAKYTESLILKLGDSYVMQDRGSNSHENMSSNAFSSMHPNTRSEKYIDWLKAYDESQNDLSMMSPSSDDGSSLDSQDSNRFYNIFVNAIYGFLERVGLFKLLRIT